MEPTDQFLNYMIFYRIYRTGNPRRTTKRTIIKQRNRPSYCNRPTIMFVYLINQSIVGLNSLIVARSVANGHKTEGYTIIRGGRTRNMRSIIMPCGKCSSNRRIGIYCKVICWNVPGVLCIILALIHLVECFTHIEFTRQWENTDPDIPTVYSFTIAFQCSRTQKEGFISIRSITTGLLWADKRWISPYFVRYLHSTEILGTFTPTTITGSQK